MHVKRCSRHLFERRCVFGARIAASGDSLYRGGSWSSARHLCQRFVVATVVKVRVVLGDVPRCHLVYALFRCIFGTRHLSLTL